MHYSERPAVRNCLSIPHCDLYDACLCSPPKKSISNPAEIYNFFTSSLPGLFMTDSADSAKRAWFYCRKCHANIKSEKQARKSLPPRTHKFPNQTRKKVFKVVKWTLIIIAGFFLCLPKW